MATLQDVQDITAQINEVWDNPPVRLQIFGNALRSIAIHKIRGLDAHFEFSWPVVAIAGTNGCGKTTVLQLSSAAYTGENTARRQYTIGRWVGPALAALGEAPAVQHDSTVRFQFLDDTPTIDVRYIPERTRWGYPRRRNPSRHVEFIGIGRFAPRIEKTDRTHQSRGRLEVREAREFNARVVESFSRVMDYPYQNASLLTVSVPGADWTDEVPFLRRGDVGYTEPNMGAGEQKLFRLIGYLEFLPRQSLILLEEPELTLHPDAQFGLAWYLMTLARRRGHQIIIATHSEAIFAALPPEGRILISREVGQTTVLHKAPRLSAARAMSKSVRANGELILVEDEVAKEFLTAIIRKHSEDLRRNAAIVEIGSSADVRRVVQSFREQNVRAVGVRDPDIGAAEADGLFSLPGDAPVEAILIEPQNIIRAAQFVAGIHGALERATTRGLGHAGSERAKRILAALATELNYAPDVVADRLTLAWLMDDNNNALAQTLVASIVQALHRDQDG